MDYDLELGDTISVAFETNGKGFMGFLVDLPGAFIRGTWIGPVRRASRVLCSLLGKPSNDNRLLARLVSEMP